MDESKLLAYQHLAIELLSYACNGYVGRDELDSIYQQIVEHRDGPTAEARKKYSSCADLAHWLYYRLGVRAKFINRKEHTGWKSGVNLNRWVGPRIGTNPYGIKPKFQPTIEVPVYKFEPGDVVTVNNSSGGHVMCVTGQQDNLLHTSEYGQPGGRLRSHTINYVKSGEVKIGSNPVISHVSLRSVLQGEEKNLSEPDFLPLVGYQTQEAIDSLKSRFVQDL